MVKVKDLTEVTVTDLWQEIKEQFWEDVNTETLRLIRRPDFVGVLWRRN
jgi:hypothetical protein